jgi:hypothetical protein
MGLLDFLFRPPSMAKFADLFAQELRRAGVSDELKIDLENDRILRGSGGSPEIITLSNFYREYLSLPAGSRKAHLRQRAQMFAGEKHEFPDDFDEARGHLRPKLWCRGALSKLQLQIQIDGGDPEKFDIPEYECGSHLVASLVYDLPETMASVSKEQLEKWGTTYYEALEIARENLEQEPFTFAKIGDGLYASATGDSYDACRLLLPSVMAKFEVKGELVAMIPNRDTLLVAGTDDEQSLAIMVDLAAKALEAPRPMVPIPLRLEDDEWIDWQPPRGHALETKFKELALGYLLQEYQDQQQMLNKLHEKAGTDIFVASLSGIRKDDGTVYSYAVWAKDCDSLLPRADWITFFRGEGDLPANAPWEKVEQIVGHLMEPTADYPIRYRVKEFPSDAELAALGSNDP